MSKYDDEYFLIKRPMRNPKIPGLQPDENTEERQFYKEGPPSGSPPLVFFNADKENYKRAGIIADVPEILFAGMSLIVSQKVRDKLLLIPVENMFMHSTVYIDDNDHWHEDFWYLTLSEQLDCWDRETSVYPRHLPIELGDVVVYTVKSFRLDDKVLDKIPLQDRLLFKMGGAINAYVVCHQSILPIFSCGGKSGADLVQISQQ